MGSEKKYIRWHNCLFIHQPKQAHLEILVVNHSVGCTLGACYNGTVLYTHDNLCIISIHTLHVANKCNWKSGSVYQLNCNYQVYITLFREYTQTSHHSWKTISNSCSTKSADDSREINNTTGNLLFLVRTPIKESDGTALLTGKNPVQVQDKCSVCTYIHT